MRTRGDGDGVGGLWLVMRLRVCGACPSRSNNVFVSGGARLSRLSSPWLARVSRRLVSRYTVYRAGDQEHKLECVHTVGLRARETGISETSKRVSIFPFANQGVHREARKRVSIFDRGTRTKLEGSAPAAWSRA